MPGRLPPSLVRPLRLPILLLASLLAACGSPPDDPADLILHNARVWTGDDAMPWAQAVAVRGDRIALVGDDAEVLALRGPRTDVRDLAGRFVSPGFIDNHTHFNRAGELLLGINLLAVSDAEGLAREVEATASRLPGGAWMLGGMWGAYEEWALSSTGQGGDLEGPAELFRPDRTLIDPVSPDNPALLWNWDRSLHLANSMALEAAGADCAWAGVECEGGVPTGRLSREAADRVRTAIPPKEMGQKLAEARMALADLARHGVTTFFDITPPDQVGVYHRLREAGELTARVNMRLPEPLLSAVKERAKARGIPYQRFIREALKIAVTRPGRAERG